MPKVKSGFTYGKKYNADKLEEALKAVENGSMSKNKAAKIFNVPRSTIQFRMKNPLIKCRHGPPTILTTEEEESLKNWIFECCKRGFPRRIEDIQCSVKQFLDSSPRVNPFKDNYPGVGWYKAFLRRHDDLAIRTPEGVTSSSAKVTEENIRDWFKNINKYLVEKGLDDILNNPTRIFNGDETGFQLCPQNKKVLSPKGFKNVYEIDIGKAKSQITVMFTFGASGYVTPPMVIYPYKRLPAVIAASVPKDWGIGLSDTGWMKSEVFYEYIGNVFHPALIRMGIEFPVILFVDGHKTHLDRKLSELCNCLKIILIALYPNSTRILQPADVSAFRPIKSFWKAGVLDWRREHPAQELNKEVFAKILIKVVNKIKSSSLVNGFRACGLYPWNPDAVDYSKCLGIAAEREIPRDLRSKTLNYVTFINIVGQKFIQKCEEMENNKENNDPNNIESENFMKLYKLWKEFYAEETQEINIDAIEENTIYNSQIKNDSNEDTYELGNKFIDEPLICENSIEDNELFTNEFISTLPVITEEEYYGMRTSSQSGSLPSEIAVTDTNEEKCNHHHKYEREDIPIAHSVSASSSKPQHLPGKNSPNVIIQKVENVKLPMSEFFHYPEAPKRKGKNVEKLPFVITSEDWQRKMKEKEDKKMKEEEEKEERKRQRVIKKENAEKIKELKKTEVQKKKRIPKKKILSTEKKGKKSQKKIRNDAKLKKNEKVVGTQKKKTSIPKKKTLKTTNASQ